VAPWLGPALGVLSAAAAVAGVVLAAGPGGRSFDGLVHDNVLNNAVNGFVIGVLATWLTRVRPGNRTCWLMLLLAWSNAATILGEGWALASYRVGLPGLTVAAWLGSWPWAPGFVASATLLPLVFPSGRTASRTGRRLAVLALLACLAVAVSVAGLDDTYRGTVPGHRLGHNPVSGGHLHGPLQVLAVVGALLAAAAALLAWGHTVRRLWRSASPEREQLAWLLLASIPVVVGGVLAPAWLFFAISVLSPVCVALGIVKFGILDVKPVLRSGLLYGLLVGFASALYFGVISGITLVTSRGTVPTLFAVATVGLLVVPAHRLLLRATGRLVYGERHDPVRALSRVAEGIRSMPAAQEATDLTPMLRGISSVLRSPYVAVLGVDGQELASVGSVGPAHPRHRVALEHAGRVVGTLVVAGRTERNPLSRRDRALVEVLAAPVAAAVRAGLLAAEVTRSKGRITAVRDAERRRLRRDLHDGLGPSLSGVALGLEAAQGAVGRDPARLQEILGVLHGEVGMLVTEIRHIIDDLAPSSTDLLAGLESQVRALGPLGSLRVQVERTAASGESTPVPAALTEAARLIVGEALTNVVRHAGAGRATVSVAFGPEDLEVTVTDDGRGGALPRDGGVGLQSMRERAELAGGSLLLDSPPGAGTTIRFRVPLLAGEESR
jgi:signal transduction histidine kinase